MDWQTLRPRRQHIVREINDVVQFTKCNYLDKRNHRWCSSVQCLAILMAYQQCSAGQHCDIAECLCRHENTT